MDSDFKAPGFGTNRRSQKDMERSLRFLLALKVEEAAEDC
jgi:hypothetical protein